MTSTMLHELQWPIDDLPGAELVLEGLADAAAGRVTIFSCLVSIAAPRLLRGGLLSPAVAAHVVHEPERALYCLLKNEPGDAYGRYNALLRRLVSFERALDHRLRD